jgi:hypothetical protein
LSCSCCPSTTWLASSSPHAAALSRSHTPPLPGWPRHLLALPPRLILVASPSRCPPAAWLASSSPLATALSRSIWRETYSGAKIGIIHGRNEF